MAKTTEWLGQDETENYWRHIRVKALELALREAEAFSLPKDTFDLFERANQIFSYLDQHKTPDD
jgi:hypothetical protein